MESEEDRTKTEQMETEMKKKTLAHTHTEYYFCCSVFCIEMSIALASKREKYSHFRTKLNNEDVSHNK